MTDFGATTLMQAVLGGDATAVPALADIDADLPVALGRSEFVLEHEAVIAVLSRLAG